jgi:hypothetical protein
MKRVRSLKIELPLASELDRAREEIFGRLKSHDPNRNKIKIVCASEAEHRRAEAIVEDIARHLRAHQRPEQAPVYRRNLVVLACSAVETAKPSTKPIVVENITTDLAAAATELLRILGNPDVPPFVFTVFHTVPKWNQFIDHLESLTKLTYRKPPRNFDRVKRACAVMAWLLITRLQSQFQLVRRVVCFATVAGLLHQFVYPTTNGIIADLKTACDKVLKDVKAGCNLETERL